MLMPMETIEMINRTATTEGNHPLNVDIRLRNLTIDDVEDDQLVPLNPESPESRENRLVAPKQKL